jgi:phosphoribosylamine---glycine ligase
VNVLIIGGGGREHALAWKLRQDDSSIELVSAPGNPGIATLARCHAVAPTDTAGLLDLVRRERIGLAIVGPEAPLELGLADMLQEARVPVFGPVRGAAAIETSKGFAKELMLRKGVPTARATLHTDSASAKRAARELGAPVVIKASGLAAGKGVVVAPDLATADEAIDNMLERHAFGSAGAEVLVEEFMEGEELSIFALTDGSVALTMIPAQDHKRLLDGDRGPNTGGMGSYAPVTLASQALLDEIRDRIFHPVLEGLREAGTPFRGLLYAGVMVTADGPRIVEFNCRFGDPETQTLLPLLDSNLLDPILAVARGDGLAGCKPFRWKRQHAVTTVIAAEGYPGTIRAGRRLVLRDEDDPCLLVFHAGTGLDADGELVATGGRVLAVTGLGDSLQEARERSVGYAEGVVLAGKQFRTDIGWREMKRRAGAT